VTEAAPTVARYVAATLYVGVFIWLKWREWRFLRRINPMPWSHLFLGMLAYAAVVGFLYLVAALGL